MLDDWRKIAEFMSAHEREVEATIQEAPLLRAAWESLAMLLPGLLLEAYGGHSAKLMAALMVNMTMAYMLGQRASGIETVDEWLGAKKEEG